MKSRGERVVSRTIERRVSERRSRRSRVAGNRLNSYLRSALALRPALVLGEVEQLANGVDVDVPVVATAPALELDDRTVEHLVHDRGRQGVDRVAVALRERAEPGQS